MGFVGARPTPLSRQEVVRILQVGTGEAVVRVKRTRPALGYEVGESIRVKEGPFADLTGIIADIYEGQLRLKVLLDILGRQTPVQFDFGQVAKL
jgi:transcriptional antiterminator NusG